MKDKQKGELLTGPAGLNELTIHRRLSLVYELNARERKTGCRPPTWHPRVPSSSRWKHICCNRNVPWVRTFGITVRG